MLLAPEDGTQWAAFLAAATTSCSRPGCCLPSLPLRARHCATARGDPLSAAWPSLRLLSDGHLRPDRCHKMLWSTCLQALVFVCAHHMRSFSGVQPMSMRRRTVEGAHARNRAKSTATASRNQRVSRRDGTSSLLQQKKEPREALSFPILPKKTHNPTK